MLGVKKAMEFSNNWFDPHVSAWNAIIPTYKPQKILEIGSYEGRSVCHLIALLGNERTLDITCVDTWEGGAEHEGTDMFAVEQRFDRNVTAVVGGTKFPAKIRKLKSRSDVALCGLIALGEEETYDLIYIDGSHETPDVLSDGVLCFKLLKISGLMIFDDYLWGLGQNKNPLTSPKMGIDAFLNCFQGKMQVHPWMPNYQLYCRKLTR